MAPFRAEFIVRRWLAQVKYDTPDSRPEPPPGANEPHSDRGRAGNGPGSDTGLGWRSSADAPEIGQSGTAQDEGGIRANTDSEVGISQESPSASDVGGDSEIRAGFAEAGTAPEKVRAQVLNAVESRLFGAISQPFRIGRFTVLEQLGMGGMGVVYTAHDPHLERQIAIKVVRGDRGARDDDPARARMLREAQAMARLSHPNVISVYEVGEFEDQVYIAMEFVRGCSMREWLDQEKRSLDEILDVFLQAGRGLSAAHAEGVVHRDFKPDNALVGEDGRVRVVDFGLAASSEGRWGRDSLSHEVISNIADSDEETTLAMLDRRRPAERSEGPGGSTSQGLLDRVADTGDLTREGVRVGTPNYMAPEQHAGDVAHARSDQFSFCVALYRALYGEHPFAGAGDPLALRRSVLAGALKTPTQLAQRPRGLWKIVSRGLCLHPAERYAGMDELLADLDRVGFRRRRILWAVGGGCVALLSLGVSLGVWSARSETLGPCAELAAQAEELWTEETSDQVQRQLAAAAAPERFAAVDKRIKDQLSAFQSAYAQICINPGELGRAPDLAAVDCLDGRLLELKTGVARLSTIDRKQLPHWQRVVDDLAEAGFCSDADTRGIRPRAHAEAKVRAEVLSLRMAMAHAAALREAGQYVEAAAAAKVLGPRIEALPDDAVEAEWQLFLGECAVHRGAIEEAGAAFQLALAAAQRSGHVRVEAAVTAARVDLVGFHRAEGNRSLRGSFEALPGAAATPALELKFHEGQAMAHLTRGRFEAAAVSARKGYELAISADLDHRSVAARLAFAQILLGRYAAARESVERALDDLSAKHPAAVLVHGVAGLWHGFRGHGDRARWHFEQSLSIEAKLDDRQPHFRGMALSYMAYLTDNGGPDSLRAQQEGLAAIAMVWGQKHPSTGRAHYHLGMMLLRRGQLEPAMTEFESTRSIFSSSHGFDNRVLAQAETGIALVELARGNDVLARALLEKAVARLDEGEGHPSEDAKSRFALARAIQRDPSATAEDRARARGLAVLARRAYDGLGPTFKVAKQEIDAWLAPNPENPQNSELPPKAAVAEREP